MKKILIVDDNLDHLGLLEYVICKAGYYSPQTVRCGLEAINIAKQEDFDLMMIDIRLPDMSGFQVISAVRQMARHKKTRVIAMSADPKIAKENWAEIGADDIIILPNSLAQYAKKINKLLL